MKPKTKTKGKIHSFGQQSIEAKCVNMTWLEVIGLATVRTGVLEKGKWHTVDFNIKDMGNGEFYISEFRIINFKVKK